MMCLASKARQLSTQELTTQEIPAWLTFQSSLREEQNCSLLCNIGQ